MTPSIWSRPMLALVVLLVLFGHDTLMATGPHGQDVSHHASHQADGAASGSECHAPEGVRTAAPDGPVADTSTSAVSTGMAHMCFPEIRAIAWGTEPGAPPDVRRAFLQVYLN